MQTLRARPGLHRGGILSLRVEDILPNPVQPRKRFDEEGLRELSESIRSYGILNPLTVRLRCGQYELVAGERRLRAAKLAGLREVPCILVDVNMEDAGLLARKSQSAVANKLRLLKLPEDVLLALRQNGLSERHGRALLRLPDPDSQRAALAAMLEQRMNVTAAESYVDALLSPPQTPERTEGERHRQRKTFVMKDLRLFLNTLSRSVDLMRQGGIGADMKKEETEESLILTISIPKARSEET